MKDICFMNWWVSIDGVAVLHEDLFENGVRQIYHMLIKEGKFTSRVGYGDYDEEEGLICWYFFNDNWISDKYDLITDFECDCQTFVNKKGKPTPNSKWIYDDDYNDGLFLFVPLDDLSDYFDSKANPNRIKVLNDMFTDYEPYKWFEDWNE